MNVKQQERATFSLGEFLYAVSLIVVVLALIGTLMRRDAESRAKTTRQRKAWRQHEPTITEQIAATASVIEQERKRLPRLQILGDLKYSRSGESKGEPGWKYELQMTSPGNGLVNVEASASIVDGVLTPITITSAGGVEDRRVVDLLAEVYSNLGWKFTVKTSNAPTDACQPASE